MRKRMVGWMVGTAMLAPCSGAWGQVTGDEPASEGASASRSGLEDIVVTARRRAESIQKVPVAVTAVTAKTLQDQHIFEAFQLPSIAPSLQVQSTAKEVGAKNFSIRGIGTAVFGPQIESSVAIVIDDVVYARPSMAVVQFFDLDSIEVLRGPQGTLFGKNASAGLVNITTAQPRMNSTEGLVNGSIGFANSATSGLEATMQGALNLPVSDNSAVRMSAFFTRQDGFVKNINHNEDLGLSEFGGRLKYLWQATDNLDLYFLGDYAQETGPAGGVLIRGSAARGGVIAGLDAAAGITPGRNNIEIASDAPTTYSFKTGGVQSRITYRFGGGGTLSNIASYRKYTDDNELDTDLLPLAIVNKNGGGRDYSQFSNELRYTSPSASRLSYQVGLYFLDLKANEHIEQGVALQPLLAAPPAGFVYNVGAIQDSRARSKSGAAFFEGQFLITDDFHVTGGIRYTHDDLEYFKVTTNPRAVRTLYPLGTVGGQQKTNNVSYRAGIDYSFAPDILAYVTYARGYKGPTFDAATGSRVSQEIARSAEIGLKSTLLDRRLRVNVALFHTVFDGYQAQVQNPLVVGQFLTLNAGNLKSKGIEVEINAAPAPGVTLNGGVTYNDTKYSNFGGVPCYFGQPTGASGVNVCLPGGSTNISGNQLQNAPKWSLVLTPRYEHDFGGLTGFVQVEYSYRSTFYYTATYDPVARIGAYSLFGGSIGVRNADRKAELSLFVRNAFDKRIPTYILADSTSAFFGDDRRGGNYWQQMGTTSFRTIGASATYRF